MSEDTITIIDFSHPITAIANLADLPKNVQEVIATATLINASGFQQLDGFIEEQRVWSAGGHWSRPGEDENEGAHEAKFTIDSIGWSDDGRWCWSDRDGLRQVKTAQELVEGDRIQFTTRDLITRALEDYQPLAAEVIRTIPVFGNDRIMILTSAGSMIPVEPGRSFALVEGDYDTGATQQVLPPVPKAETHEGVSLE